MKYMVKIQLQPGAKPKAVESFEVRGPHRNPGVKFLGAWIGKDADVVFALVEADSEEHLTAAGDTWRPFGAFEVFSVIDVEQY